MKKKYKEARLKNISQWHMNRVEHCNIWDIYEREPDIPRLPENTNCSINWQTLSGSIWDRLNLRNPSFVYNCAIGAIQSVWSVSAQRRVVTLFPKRGGQVESGDLLFINHSLFWTWCRFLSWPLDAGMQGMLLFKNATCVCFPVIVISSWEFQFREFILTVLSLSTQCEETLGNIQTWTGFLRIVDKMSSGECWRFTAIPRNNCW